MNQLLSSVLVLLAVALSGCASLPPPAGRTETTALTDTGGTLLGRAVAPSIAANPGKTGVHPLFDPRDAFAARIAFAGAAQKSLDLQYYIWHGDTVGNLMFEALSRAADRGVRVRLLLDDHNTAGLDRAIAALDAHPNIEVRLYNPHVHRDARSLDFVTEFARVNRRMHNKSFTADNQVAVVGGRNIGNEYFGAGSDVVFADLDVAVVGAVVPEVSREFDLYWNSPSSYPAAAFAGTAGADGARDLQEKFAQTRSSPEAAAYLEAVRTSPLVARLVERKVAFEWTGARVYHDDPAKTLDADERVDDLLFPKLLEAMGRPRERLDLVSPYFVPGDGGTALLVAAAGRGVRVRILTNSLASSDEPAVHAGYAKRRGDLLRAGVRLYELKPTAATEAQAKRDGFEPKGSAGLHAKTFAVDGARIFVGSFNMDQRSMHLNTEMGVVLDSPALAQALGQTFDRTIPEVAYEVRLDSDGRTPYWIERTANGEVRHDTEPATTAWQRMGVEVLSILPIEWLL